MLGRVLAAQRQPAARARRRRHPRLDYRLRRRLLRVLRTVQQPHSIVKRRLYESIGVNSDNRTYTGNKEKRSVTHLWTQNMKYLIRFFFLFCLGPILLIGNSVNRRSTVVTNYYNYNYYVVIVLCSCMRAFVSSCRL